jgi:putative Holliday junction resolvase
MKYLGIDYGTKKIGIAISDESGKFAFPREIVPAGVQALRDIVEMAISEDVNKIVVGHSLNTSGERNVIMEDIDVFVEELVKLTGLPVALSDERFSSTAVKAFDWSKPVATPHRSEKRYQHIDDRAAAIMLQRYLDKQ